MTNPNSILITRRSVRVFNDKPVEQEKLDYILETAMYAPSTGNQRGWEFVVSQNRENFIKMLDVSKYYASLKTAHTVVLVCYNKDTMLYDYAAIPDSACVTFQLMLAAKEQEVGSAWLAVDPEDIRMDKAREVFGLPDNVVPYSLICLGYTDNPIPIPTDRFDKKKIHLETFKGV